MAATNRIAGSNTIVMLSFPHIVETTALAIDGAGIVVIVSGLIVAVFRCVRYFRGTEEAFRRLRQDIGRGILLGLELLVAADIIRTVAVAPTMEGVLILGLIVLIRTFLSMALQVELEGRWPWTRARGEAAVDEHATEDRHG